MPRPKGKLLVATGCGDLVDGMEIYEFCRKKYGITPWTPKQFGETIEGWLSYPITIVVNKENGEEEVVFFVQTEDGKRLSIPLHFQLQEKLNECHLARMMNFEKPLWVIITYKDLGIGEDGEVEHKYDVYFIFKEG